MTNRIHAHVAVESQDCDSRYSHAHDVFMNEEEVAESTKEVNDFSEIHFMNRVFANECGPYAVVTATITITEAGVEYNESTEEGYRRKFIAWCHDDCTDEGQTLYRDHAAEAAGY